MSVYPFLSSQTDSLFPACTVSMRSVHAAVLNGSDFYTATRTSLLTPVHFWCILRSRKWQKALLDLRLRYK